MTTASARRWSWRRRLTAGLAAAAVLVAAVAGGVGLGLRAAEAGLGGTAVVPTQPNTGGSGTSGNGGGTAGGSELPNGGTGSGQGSSGQGTQQTIDSQPATASESQGVVLIDTALPGGEAAGTGIVLTADGQILTNYHVVEGSTLIRVTVPSTGVTYTGTLVGAAPSKDVALVQLTDASGLQVATMDTDTTALGDAVTAVGNAGGQGDLTAADGTITRLSVGITTQAEGPVVGERLTGMIQTDADVVAGDSGGPLIDAQGEVVGVTTAASSDADPDGFAIPIDTALGLVQQIRSGQETATVRIGPNPFLGIEVATTTGRGRTSSAATGALVAGVSQDGAAAAAGLQAGDTITAIGSDTISTATQVTQALAAHQPGDRVDLHWTDTDGTAHHTTVTLGTSPIN